MVMRNERPRPTRPNPDDRPKIDARVMTEGLRAHLQEQGGINFTMRDGEENVTVLLRLDSSTRRYSLEGAVGHHFKKPDGSLVTFAEDLSDAPRALREAMIKRQSNASAVVEPVIVDTAEVGVVLEPVPATSQVNRTEPRTDRAPAVDATGRALAGKYRDDKPKPPVEPDRKPLVEVVGVATVRPRISDDIPHDELPTTPWYAEKPDRRTIIGKIRAAGEDESNR